MGYYHCELEETAKGELSASYRVKYGDRLMQPVEIPPTDSAKVLNHLLHGSSIASGLLPPSLRYISTTKNTIIFERPPMYVRMSYYNVVRKLIGAKSIDEQLTFLLPIPWTVYRVMYDPVYLTPNEIYMYFAMESVNKYTQLYLAPLLNFYKDTRLCRPAYGKYEPQEATYAALMQQSYNTVWNSGFNFDLYESIYETLRAGYLLHLLPEGTSINEQFGNISSIRIGIQNFFQRWSESVFADVFSWNFYPIARFYDIACPEITINTSETPLGQTIIRAMQLVGPKLS